MMIREILIRHIAKCFQSVKRVPEGSRHDRFRGSRRTFPPQDDGGFRLAAVSLSARVTSFREIEIDSQEYALILETALTSTKLETEPEITHGFFYPKRAPDAGPGGRPDAPVRHFLSLREAALSVFEVDAERSAAGAKSESTVIYMDAT